MGIDTLQWLRDTHHHLVATHVKHKAGEDLPRQDNAGRGIERGRANTRDSVCVRDWCT